MARLVPTVSLTRTGKADACDMAADSAAVGQDQEQVTRAVVASAASGLCASSGGRTASTQPAAATFKASVVCLKQPHYSYRLLDSPVLL